MSDDKKFRVWACNNGEECGGHKDGDHGRRHTIEAHSAERAAEEAGEELTGVNLRTPPSPLPSEREHGKEIARELRALPPGERYYVRRGPVSWTEYPFLSALLEDAARTKDTLERAASVPCPCVAKEPAK